MHGAKSSRPSRNYGSVTGTTVDHCGRCGATNVTGILLVVPDGDGEFPSVLDLCASCALGVATSIVAMVNSTIVQPSLKR